MKNEINYGINILKILMSFEVVVFHFLSPELSSSYKPFSLFGVYAVPCFMIIAFYFAATIFYNNDKSKLKKRIKRLLIPHIAWTAIYMLFYNIFNIGYKKWDHEILFVQLFFGHSINGAMWFQVNIIFLTLLISVIFLVCREYNLRVEYMLSLISIICLIIQYRGLYLFLFNISGYYSYPIGRIFEMFPYATCGILLYKYNVLERLCLNLEKIATIILCVLIGYLFTGMNSVPTGFVYSGITYIIVALCLVTGFYILPFNRVNGKVKTVINWFAKYTGGIYYMHMFCAAFINQFILKVAFNQQGSFLLCVCIYVCSFVNLFLISLIPLKICKAIVS